MNTFIWVMGYIIIGVLFAVLSVYYNYKRNGVDGSYDDTLVAVITICIWPLLLGAIIFSCIAAVPIYFGKKLWYRKVESNDTK